jgi:hypothetical protein
MVSLRRRLPALRRTKPADPEPDASSTAPEGEALLPRWLRPSVRAARVESLKAPAPAAPTERRAPLVFAGPAGGATERLVVRYDRVQLLDRPDDALGMPRGELDTGDEIEIVERDVIWAHVRTPANRDGWVPAMTLAPADAMPPEPASESSAEQPPGTNGQTDGPALEELLAIAAERRALADAQPPVIAEEPPKPAAQAATAPRTPRKKQPNPAHKSKKPARHTSTRKKRH